MIVALVLLIADGVSLIFYSLKAVGRLSRGRLARLSPEATPSHARRANGRGCARRSDQLLRLN